MKTTILAAVLMVAGCAEQGGTGASGAWRTDYAGALAEAKSAGKPVLLDFHADW
ncbi:MAG: thioredoxin family protein [Planctomycetes bacterium]|nr:thioredoxin family protein [Planctomycetota bacterium]